MRITKKVVLDYKVVFTIRKTRKVGAHGCQMRTVRTIITQLLEARHERPQHGTRLPWKKNHKEA